MGLVELLRCSAAVSTGSVPMDRPDAGIVTGATLVTTSLASKALASVAARSSARRDSSVSS